MARLSPKKRRFLGCVLLMEETHASVWSVAGVGVCWALFCQVSVGMLGYESSEVLKTSEDLLFNCKKC